ncbi:MAG: choice-of-anchor Q domain-containing protein [Verrucomicrobiota bacterium]
MKRRLLATLALALAGCLFEANSSPATLHYVDANGTTATPPYTNWVMAATNIQDAVSIASTGDEIIVTNGVYPGTVNVTNPLALVSVNGPQFTLFNGGGTHRCAFLTDGASLTGFTLTNGSTTVYGGGVYCESTNAFLTNCVITGNRANGYAITEPPYGVVLGFAGQGGGVYGCTLYSCIVNNNQARGGVWVHSRWALPVFKASNGGGVFGSTLFNCLLAGNYANAGGGAANCTLYNCTLTGNVCNDSSLSTGSGLLHAYGRGGGAAGGVLYNCIAYFNKATGGANYDTGCILNYCCTAPLSTNGVGNITNAPLFMDTNGWSNLRLQSNSPCINAGNNAYVTTATDLDGNPRIAGGTVDMGAYEFQPGVCGGQFGGAAYSPLTGFSFTFSGATIGQPYRIQTSPSLAAGSWTALTNFSYTGPITITDPSAVAGPKKFYRAVSP